MKKIVTRILKIKFSEKHWMNLSGSNYIATLKRETKVNYETLPDTILFGEFEYKKINLPDGEGYICEIQFPSQGKCFTNYKNEINSFEEDGWKLIFIKEV